MDLDKALVSAILREGSNALNKASQMGVTAARLNGEGKAAFDFVTEYFRKNGAMPVVQQILGKTGIVIDEDEFFGLEDVPDKSANFFIEEVNNRHLHGKIQQGLDKIIQKQTARQPIEAYQVLENLAAELRAEQIGMSNVQPLWKLGPDVQNYYDRIKRGERGVLTPWPSLNDATMGFWPEDLVLFAARLGMGKCVDATTELYDPMTGIPHTIEKIVKDDRIQQVTSWSKTEGIHARQITAKVDTGRKDCLEFTLSSGRKIIVTPEHPFLTSEGWRRAEQLSTTETVALPHQMPFPEEPQAMDPAELDVLSVLLAEGSTSGHHIGFSSKEPEILRLMQDAAKKLGVVVKFRGGVDYDFVGEVTRQNKVLDLARREGLWGVKAKDKTLPENVFRLDRTQLARFLAVFWMCDGYVDKGSVAICLASQKLVFQIQSLLLRFGIQSRVAYKKASCNGKKFDSWRLTIYAESFSLFGANIQLWGEKKARMTAHVARSRNSNVGFPTVSPEFTKELRSRFCSKVGSGSNRLLLRTGRALGWKSHFGFRNLFGRGNSLLLNRFAEFCRQAGVENEFQWLWDSDIFWDKIVKIQKVGERKIYDLTVRPTECFVANDIIIHNTWTAVQLALHAWSTPKPQTGERQKVLFITTEVSQLRIAMRFLAAHEKLPYGEFTHGKLSFFSEQKLKTAIERYFNDDYLHIIGGDFDFQIESVASAIDTVRPDLVVLDGVYLLKVQGANRNERMANAFDECKRLAKRKKVPLIIFTQFNREVKKDLAKTVQVESIALSDVGGWNADLIVGLVQTDEMKQAKQMTLKPLKVREGEGKEILVNWDFERMNFSELNNTGGGGGDADENGTSLDVTDPAEDDDLPF